RVHAVGAPRGDLPRPGGGAGGPGLQPAGRRPAGHARPAHPPHLTRPSPSSAFRVPSSEGLPPWRSTLGTAVAAASHTRHAAPAVVRKRSPGERSAPGAAAMADVFISYSRRDRGYVEELAAG